MSEGLFLEHYNRELAALRRDAGLFAERYPRQAQELRLSRDTADDPFVERLLEGVAFLAARVQHRLDDEVPELSDALLDMLAPGLLAPVPSMTTLRLGAGLQPGVPAPGQRGPLRVPRGLAVETAPLRPHGEPVRFRTTHAVTLWPILIEEAWLSSLPSAVPAHPRAAGAQACLRLRLRTAAPSLSFAEVGLDRLRLHLRGTGAEALHELLCTATLSVALGDGHEDPRPTILPREALRPAGFEAEEAALPWPRRAFSGHRLLTEYFAFPEGFLYLDLDGLEARCLRQRTDHLEVFVFLSRAARDLERFVGAESFAMHCTPAVNLFPKLCEPIALDGTRSEWLVVPEARAPAAMEIHAVEAVRESRPSGERRDVLPFHRLGRAEAEGAEAAPAHYLARRSGAPPPLGGTQTHLLLRDGAFDPARPADGVLTVEALCCNRDLPAQLPFGEGEPSLRVSRGGAPVQYVECLTAPTPTLRPGLRERGAWRLVSQLALNHLSAAGGEEGALTLREILRLHDLRGSEETRAGVAALCAVDAAPAVARAPGGRPGAFARGLDVTLTFDAQRWEAGGLYLLASVLERFLALQVSVNAFVRTGVALRGRPGLVARFPPRSGTRALL